MDPTMSLGDYLYHLVRSRGLSMHDFASRCDCSPSTLSRIRTGTRMPRQLPIDLWAQVLDLDSEERSSLENLALLSQAPPELQRRLSQAEVSMHDERQRRHNVEQHYAEYRRTQNYYDGYWLAYNFSLFNDGRILRSMARVQDDQVRWINKESGNVQYSYNGKLDLLGDKVFIRLEEDRGSSEYVQISLHSLFDFREPAFLYGIITGISGKSIHHPMSNPAAAKLLMIYIGSHEHYRQNPQLLDTIEGMLGNYMPMHITPFFPRPLGDDSYLRNCLKLQKRENIDAVILKLLSNENRSDGVLCADLR